MSSELGIILILYTVTLGANMIGQFSLLQHKSICIITFIIHVVRDIKLSLRSFSKYVLSHVYNTAALKAWLLCCGRHDTKWDINGKLYKLILEAYTKTYSLNTPQTVCQKQQLFPNSSPTTNVVPNMWLFRGFAVFTSTIHFWRYTEGPHKNRPIPVVEMFISRTVKYS